MICKEGVQITDKGKTFSKPIQDSWATVDRVCFEFGIMAVMTSGFDGLHMPKSKHYSGNAYDLRLRHLDRNRWKELRDVIADALGPKFDVVLEDMKVHIHIEFDPKPMQGPSGTVAKEEGV